MKTALPSLGTLALIALLTGCAGAKVSDTASGDPSSNAQAVAGTEGVTCKTIIKTGTRLGTRVCKTDEVWAREANDSRDAINDIQRNSAQSASPSGG